MVDLGYVGLHWFMSVNVALCCFLLFCVVLGCFMLLMMLVVLVYVTPEIYHDIMISSIDPCGFTEIHQHPLVDPIVSTR